MKFGIIGAGHWGVAFGELLAVAGNDVVMWDRHDSVVSDILNNSMQSQCFPDIQLNERVAAVYDVKDLISCDVLVLALPFQVIRDFLYANKDAFKGKKFLVLSKGIEIATNMLAHQILIECIKDAKVAVLSGPNFAQYIIKHLPAATVVASEDLAFADILSSAITCEFMRCYTSNDVIGTEICGAVKNVIAIAAGICEGASMGENAKAAMITRSLVEIEKLVIAAGGKRDTVHGLAGIGDLMLTCGSRTSRNFDYGYHIGKHGLLTGDDMANSKTVEGRHTSKALKSFAEKFSIEMPISHEVYEILYNNKTVLDALHSLMSRKQ